MSLELHPYSFIWPLQRTIILFLSETQIHIVGERRAYGYME